MTSNSTSTKKGMAALSASIEVLREQTDALATQFLTASEMRAHIFGLPDLREELVDVPEWGVQILMRGLSAKQRNLIVSGALRPDGSPDLVKLTPDLVIASARHPESGESLFQPADRDALNEKSGGVLERLALVAARLSGISSESRETLKKN